MKVRPDRPAPPSAELRSTRLDCGLELISERLPWVSSVALGLAFKIGSRDDPAGTAGLAHVFEHMVFKGTPGLSARDISVRSESLGAELNAFTDKELTVFYGRGPGDTRRETTELLAEIVARPAFAPAELAKEQAVIAEEIRSTEEDPDSKALGLTLEALYPDGPMGWPVAGTLESVAGLDSTLLGRLYPERYHCGTGLAVVVGDVDHDELAAALDARLGSRASTSPGPARAPAVAGPPAVLTGRRDELTQVYACLAWPVFGYADERRYALSLLNNALGGGVSSRLFQRLREDEGLVYSISSFTELYADTGLVAVYFVADRRRLERCLAVLDEELARFRRELVSREEFDRALNMTLSSVLLAQESPASRMLRLARTRHLLGRVVGIDETVAAYRRLALDDVNRLVGAVFDDSRPRVGAVGPLATGELARLLERV
ncbi:MAG: pitrilysin family protein [bacterium]